MTTEEPPFGAALLALLLGVLVVAACFAALYFTLVSDDIRRALLAGTFGLVGGVCLHVFLNAWDMPHKERNG